LIDLLNRYYQAMSGVVIAHGGLVNKFGGDSLLAVFGTPLNPGEDHAFRAVRTAQGFLQALERFNLDQEKRAEPKLAVGVGVATGPVVAGNLGGEERLEYTVIGDAVNLASRLEAMTKQVEVSILLNQAAVLLVRDRVSLSPMGTLRVRGKREPQQVYALKRRR
jgi:adenylate cyclase